MLTELGINFLIVDELNIGKIVDFIKLFYFFLSPGWILSKWERSFLEVEGNIKNFF
jgi:hypothetical protein